MVFINRVVGTSWCLSGNKMCFAVFYFHVDGCKHNIQTIADFPPTILILYKSCLLMNVVTPEQLRSGNEDQLHTYLTMQNGFR